MPQPGGALRRTAGPSALVLALLVTGLTTHISAAPAPRAVLRGQWIATAGRATLHGGWSTQALPGSANDVVGSWTLEDEGGRVTLQGTWSARKLPGGWRGRWRAQVQPPAGTFAGTWQALPGPEFGGKTFEDLLRAGAADQIGGTWRAGAGAGAWWLKTGGG